MKVKRESAVAQSCPTLSDPMDCNPPGSSVRGIFQARGLEWKTLAAVKTCSATCGRSLVSAAGGGLRDLPWIPDSQILELHGLPSLSAGARGRLYQNGHVGELLQQHLFLKVG